MERRSLKPLVISLFIYIFFNNLLGVIPYGNTIIREIKNTISISFVLIIGLTIISIKERKLGWIWKFKPEGINIIIGSVIMIIEIFSYFLRIITLSVRLTANIQTGHLILMILSTFPMNEYFLIPFIFLEFLVSILQAIVFTLLFLSYISSI